MTTHSGNVGHTAYCMFDNHTFASIDLTTHRYSIIARVVELIERKRGASFFVHDEFDARLDCLTRMRGDKMKPAEIEEWVDAVLREKDFWRLMAA